MLKLNQKANWDNLWSSGFQFGPIDSWSADLFLTIGQLIKDIPNPKILSAGCGRGVIDYWLIQVFGCHITLLDYSKQCILNLRKSLKNVDQKKYTLSHASIFDIPYEDKSFDLVWNEGVLEHFSRKEYFRSLKEMKRVSKKYVIVDVPNASCRPYVLAKTWLEKNGMWGYGYEKPRISLKEDFKSVGIRVLFQTSIGNLQTIENYLAMVPEPHRSDIRNKLTKKDFKTFPHLLAVGEIIN